MKADISSNARPFLRWAGGKGWLSEAVAAVVRDYVEERYFEPFLGSGAVFFSMRPKSAVLSDVNSDLVTTYTAIRDDVSGVLRELSRLKVSKSDFLAIRESRPVLDVKRAARFLYLNRTCFNGLYRVNKMGNFNTPYGGGDRTPELLFDSLRLPLASAALSGAIIGHDDFSVSVSKASKGDFVYCDPAYTTKHRDGSFIRYNESLFSWRDQVRLRELADLACRRGAVVIVSNAADPSISKLYHPWRPLLLTRRSSIGASSGRGLVSEYLFVMARSRSLRSRLQSALFDAGLLDR